MIPPKQRPNIESNAERKIFEMFKSCPSDWIVLHSFDVSRCSEKETYRKKMRSEIDFLVLVPNLGIVALEVKGGEIWADENGDWYSNRKDNPIENPFQQVEDNIHIMGKKYEDRYGKNTFPFFAYGVMFPDCYFQLENQISYEQWRIFDKRHLPDAILFIKTILKKSRQLYKDKGNSLKEGPTSKELDVLAERLNPGKKDISYADWIKQTEKFQEKFSDEQLKMLYDSTIGHDRCLVEGSTGTGKTIIAIEAAKESLRNEDRIAFFCYHSVLGKWLKEQVPRAHIENTGSFVGTLHEFLLARIKQAGLRLEMPSGKDYFTELQKIPRHAPISFPEEVADSDGFWEETVPEKALEALSISLVKYDKIIIDEAQDIFVYSYFYVINEILEGGISDGRWCLYADSEQDITKKKHRIPYKEALEYLGKAKKDYSQRPPLSTNWRNSKKIAEAVSRLVNICQNTADEMESGPSEKYISWSTPEEQAVGIEKCLDHLLKNEKIEPYRITLLTTYDPHRLIRPSWYEQSVLSKISAKYKLAKYNPEEKGITYSSITSFKGMENSVIILVDVESYADANLLYVGMSRAKSILIVFESTQAREERKKLMLGT